MSISNSSAMRVKVSTDGWALLVHQRDTVATSLPKFSASHFPVLLRSIKTSFILLISFIVTSF
jgi:hypothetical protein